MFCNPLLEGVLVVVDFVLGDVEVVVLFVVVVCVGWMRVVRYYSDVGDCLCW